MLPHEPGAAGALPGDVVAVSSILALAYQRTVFPVKPQRTACARRKDSRSQEAVEEKHSSCLQHLKDVEPLESE